MKKVNILLVLLVLVLPLVSAININIKSNYLQGETLLGTIEGNFLTPLTQENFYFYSDRSQIPLIFDVVKIQDKYYFYALLPVEERNYTLLIKDANYFENGRENKGDLEKNFSVLGNVTDFSVSPGFLVIKNESTLTVKSLNSVLSVSAKLLNSSQTLNVPAGQEKKLLFSASGIKNFTLAEIEISALNTKYLIPVAIISQSNPTSENITETEKFRFSRDRLNYSVYEKNETIFKIYLENLNNIVIKNIKINFSGELEDVITLNPDSIDELKENDHKEIEIRINAPIAKRYYGKISASAGNFSTETYLTINSFTKNETLPPQPSPYPEKQSCSDLNGILCLSDTKCSGIIQDSSDGDCCIGTCEKATSYIGHIIGIIIILIVAGGLFFLWRRSKKGKITSLDVLKKREASFEDKIQNREIRGNLTKS